MFIRATKKPRKSSKRKLKKSREEALLNRKSLKKKKMLLRPFELNSTINSMTMNRNSMKFSRK